MPSHTSLRPKLSPEWRMEWESVRMKWAPLIWTCGGHPSHTTTSSFRGRAYTLQIQLLCKASRFPKNTTPVHLNKCRQLSVVQFKGLQLTILLGTVQQDELRLFSTHVNSQLNHTGHLGSSLTIFLSLNFSFSCERKQVKTRWRRLLTHL